MVTGEEKHLNTTNSEFKGTGSAEFARLENGDIYISNGGLAHWDIATDQIIYYDVTNSRIHANNCELIQIGVDSTFWVTHGYGLSKLSFCVEDFYFSTLFLQKSESES